MTLTDLINANPTATDAEIATLAQADKRTVQPISLDVLNPYLTKNGLQFAFDAAAKNEQLPIELRASLFSFNNYLTGGNKALDTSDPEFAPLIYQQMTGSVQAGILTQQQADDIIAMGGGYALANTTEADVATARRGITASALIGQSRAWEQSQNEGIANRAATFVTAVEAWRDSGTGDAPDIGSI